MNNQQERSVSTYKQPGRRLVAKNSLLNLVGQVLPMCVGVVTIPPIIRGLGANGYGILSIAFLVLGYFTIFDLGLSRATVKFVAENMSPEKVHKVPELVWTSLFLLTGMGCVGAAIAAAFVPFAVTHWLKMSPSFVGEARVALLILCASMPIMLANNCLRGVLEAAQRFDLVNFVKVPASILFYVLAVAVIPFGVHVPGIIALMVLVRFISACTYLGFCIRIFPGLRTRVCFSRKALRPLATFGGWVMITNAAGPIGGYVERFMIASVLSVGMLTYYSVPTDLVSKIVIFPMSLVPSLFPYFSYHGNLKTSEVSDVTSRAIKYLLLIMTPIAAVFIFFAGDILHLWLGPEFAAQSTLILRVVTLVFFFSALSMIPYTSVQALGRPDLKAILDLIVLPIYVCVSWWLMKRLGINGAAFARLLVTIVDGTVLFIFASRLRAFSFRDCLSGPLSQAIVSSFGLVLALFAINSLHAGLVVSIPLVLVSFILYVTIFWFLAFEAGDRAVVNRLRDRILSLVKGKPPAAIQATAADSD
jgi:O-antigen/teichoic acid export membrane protein